MKKIILFGFGKPLIELYQNLKHTYEILGIVTDYERWKKNPEFYDFVAAEKITLIDRSNVRALKPDLILVFNYNKIIDVSNADGLLFLNIHMGLLPTYRGNSANSWSILNGNRKVGYSLHQINDVLDGGKIFYRFEYEIQENETYEHARKAFSMDLKTNFLFVLNNVLNGSLKGVEQQNEKFIYTSRLIPQDGILPHWNYETEAIFNRQIVFSKPLGTGLKMKFKDQFLEITKISRILNYLNYPGFSGAIVNIVNGSIWVKTKDTAISIDAIMIDGQSVLPSTLFKIGERL